MGSAQYRQRRLDGLCVRCKNESPDRVHCPDCRQRARERRENGGAVEDSCRGVLRVFAGYPPVGRRQMFAKLIRLLADHGYRGKADGHWRAFLEKRVGELS